MKQSWFASSFEIIASTATGFLISLGLQYVVCWWYGLPLMLHDNLAIIGVFTAASLLRGIAWRRLMEALHVRSPISPAMRAVIAERQRQKDIEGWDDAHDDAHPRGQLARAGAAYLLSGLTVLVPDKRGKTRGKTHAMRPVAAEAVWPWDRESWKPQNVRRNLVRGLALGLAELEKLDRSKIKKATST